METVTRLSQRSIRITIRIGVPSLTRCVKRLARALEARRLDTASSELELIAADPNPIELLGGADEGAPARAPSLRARALGMVLIDLYLNGWGVSVEEGQVYVHAPAWPRSGRGMTPEQVSETKRRIRESLQPRLEEQATRPATQRFVQGLERPRRGPRGMVSALSLFANGRSLADSLSKQGALAIQPYLQPVGGAVQHDPQTGLLLSDIYRYFRYTWAFPYESTPGRTLPILIRDRGQPNHPVCGLLTLGSPVPKLAPRDRALGWTPDWLEAVVAALDCADGEPKDLRALEAALQNQAPSSGTIGPTGVFRDVAKRLGLGPCPNAIGLEHAVRRLNKSARASRARRARRALIADLQGELREAVGEISTQGLGIEHCDMFREPALSVAKLEQIAAKAREAWVRSRPATSARGVRSQGNPHLFRKKRAAKLLSLSRALATLGTFGLDGACTKELRAAVFGSESRWTAGHGVSAGRDVIRGLRVALSLRASRLVASQIADVVVCGAVPPYGPLLGGKLAALLALSRDVAGFYHERYTDQVSNISSQMAGREVSRPADLLAITTTSFYAVGSSQYNRVCLPDALGGARWRHVGTSAGHGSLHFSRDTAELLQELVRAETGAALITSTFGEGPSERLRKIRDGLARLDLPAGDLLQHGMPRLVYLAELGETRTAPGARGRTRLWRRVGPKASDVAEFWRQRWLAPRLGRDASLIARTSNFDLRSATPGRLY